MHTWAIHHSCDCPTHANGSISLCMLHKADAEVAELSANSSSCNESSYLDEDRLPGPEFCAESSQHSKHGRPGVDKLWEKSRE